MLKIGTIYQLSSARAILRIESRCILQVSKVEMNGFLKFIPETSAQLVAKPVVELVLGSVTLQAGRSPLS